MGKRQSKRPAQAEAVIQPKIAFPKCPNCGKTNVDKQALLDLESLVHSHVELCAALRLIGRQLLNFEKQDSYLLNKVREVLKQAENVRRTLDIPNVSGEPDNSLDEPAAPPITPSEDGIVPKTIDNQPRSGVQRKGRLTRPRSLRILKFPG
jgi:hypothetical protein